MQGCRYCGGLDSRCVIFMSYVNRYVVLTFLSYILIIRLQMYCVLWFKVFVVCSALPCVCHEAYVVDDRVCYESLAVSSFEFLACRVRPSENLRFATHSNRRKNHSRRIWHILQQFPVISDGFVVVFSLSRLASSLASSLVVYGGFILYQVWVRQSDVVLRHLGRYTRENSLPSIRDYQSAVESNEFLTYLLASYLHLEEWYLLSSLSSSR